ncbi:MAG: arsenic transporter [Armatimonadetes bacterium]|nr:arsenic transporter [Armatimonadota bacterium]
MPRITLTLAIFLLTLALILIRPRGLHEAWATVLGGGLMLLCGLETGAQAWRTVAQGADVLLFLLALLLLSDLLRASGFFEWAAILAARAAGGDGRALFRNVFLLGALITAFLSLDTTAVILTPIVLSFVGRLRLTPRPFLLACAFVANTGSLLLPVSNLTNLLFVSAFRIRFETFALHMALPLVVAVAVNYALFRRLFGRDLPDCFDEDALPPPGSVLPDAPYFRGAVAVLLCVLIGYFVGSLTGVPPYVIALAGCAALLAWGLWRRQVDWGILREITWPLFPFVIGLFVVVRGVENLGLAGAAARGLADAGRAPLAQILATAFGAGVGSNVVNNIPMALLAISVLKHVPASVPAQYGALLGCDLGPNLTVAGSLATMLVISSARRQGEDIGARQFFAVGVWTTPPLLLVSGLALWLTLRLFP